MFSAKGLAYIETGAGGASYPTVIVGFQLTNYGLYDLIEKKIEDRSIINIEHTVGIVGVFVEIRDHANPVANYFAHIGKTTEKQKSDLEEAFLASSDI